MALTFYELITQGICKKSIGNSNQYSYFTRRLPVTKPRFGIHIYSMDPIKHLYYFCAVQDSSSDVIVYNVKDGFNYTTHHKFDLTKFYTMDLDYINNQIYAATQDYYGTLSFSNVDLKS